MDFVIRSGRRLVAVEVKSGRVRDARSGLGAFEVSFGPARLLLVGGDGIPLEEFLLRPAERWLND